MKNKLSQEYKDDLYEKVLEKKRIRTVRRKKMLSIFIVFVSIVGFTTLGFSLKGQDDYHNFFTSETENIMIEDEYQYFDDLGIKLEFINIDDNSLTLGINIKYEDKADSEIDFEKIILLNENYDEILVDSALEWEKSYNLVELHEDYWYLCKSEFTYITDYKLKEMKKNDVVEVNIKNILIDDKIVELEYKKEISIED